MKNNVLVMPNGPSVKCSFGLWGPTVVVEEELIDLEEESGQRFFVEFYLRSLNQDLLDPKKGYLRCREKYFQGSLRWGEAIHARVKSFIVDGVVLPWEVYEVESPINRFVFARFKVEWE
jgi:hypothetical protein